MAGIEVKGSGSFKLMLDHDSVIPNAKFIIEAQGLGIPGQGNRLFSVSESGETRAYGYLKVSQSIESSDEIRVFSGSTYKEYLSLSSEGLVK